VNVVGTATHPVVTITLDRERADRYGFRGEDFAQQLTGVRTGVEVGTFSEQDGARRIVLSLGWDRSNDAVSNALLVAPSGSAIPLREVATVSAGREHTLTLRENGRPVVELHVHGRGARGSANAWRAITTLSVPTGYTVVW
jgi:Cu/Ag efflux pump CusA